MGSEGTIHTAGRVPPAPPCRCEGSATRLGGPAWPRSLPEGLDLEVRGVGGMAGGMKWGETFVMGHFSSIKFQ